MTVQVRSGTQTPHPVDNKMERPQSARSYDAPSITSSIESDFTVSLRKLVTDAVLERQRSEADLRLLQNRCRHLEVEDDKAQQRIAATKRRTAQIRAQKKRNRIKRQQQLKEKEREERKQRRMKQRRRELYGTTTTRSAKLVADRTKATHDRVRQFRQELQNINRLGAEAAQAEERRKQEIVDRIRAREMALREAKQNQQETKRAQHAAQCEAERRAELRRAAKLEAQIRRMEKAERDLIRRLRQTQMHQLEAYGDLEERITEPLGPEAAASHSPRDTWVSRTAKFQSTPTGAWSPAPVSPRSIKSPRSTARRNRRRNRRHRAARRRHTVSGGDMLVASDDGGHQYGGSIDGSTTARSGQGFGGDEEYVDDEDTDEFDDSQLQHESRVRVDY